MPTKNTSKQPSDSEADFLASYDPKEYPPVALTVDLVIFTIRNDELCVLLVERRDHPFKGKWALPGGFLGVKESIEETAVRELKEETGVSISQGHLEQLGTYGDPGRDPRMRVVTTAYLALLPELPDPVAGDDAAKAEFWRVCDLSVGGARRCPALAFDHKKILTDGLERARSKLEYTTLATALIKTPFTIPELYRVYTAVWRVVPDLPNFRRKVYATQGFVEPVPGKKRKPGPEGGPAMQLYRRGKAKFLHPAILRSEQRQIDEDDE